MSAMADPYDLSALLDFATWDWLGRINKSLSDGKCVVRKIGLQWYLVVGTIDPVPVDSQAAGVEIGTTVARFMRSLGFTNA